MMVHAGRRVVQLSVVSAAILGGLSLGACETDKHYTDRMIADVNAHLSAVDAKATDASQKADQALSAAQAAQAAATQANQRIDALTGQVESLQRAPPPEPAAPPPKTPRG
jgi:outer membrane murein-binding lipoprotein Lpp